jgi:FkbM family methyltransferase
MNIVQLVRRMLPRPVERWIRLRMWRYLWPRWTLRSGIPVEITSPADWEVYNEVFADGEYDPAIDAALADAPSSRPMVVLDLGANLGFFSLRVLDRIHTIGGAKRQVSLTLVEGSPQVLSEAISRAAYATLQQSGARLIPGLAGKGSGVATIYQSDNHVNNSIQHARGKAGTQVPYVNLETLYADVPQIDLLKCDIQGSEEALLESQPALFAKTRRAVLELHHSVCDTKKCRQLLERVGLPNQVVLRENEWVVVVHCWR